MKKPDLRLKDYVSVTSYARILQQPEHFVIQGYPDDEAILHGGGRAGASLGPTQIRQELLRMTPHVLFEGEPSIADIGDISESSVENRHSRATAQVEALLRHGHRVITLGGGHDYGYPDGRAFLTAFTERPLIINLDAHLDVRDLSKGITSGTPFFRLLEEFSSFDFAEIGIQSHCNAKAHFAYAEGKGAKILSFDEWSLSGVSLPEFVMKRLDPWLVQRRPVFLSLDMDVLAASSAPGCSAPQPLGVPALELYNLLLILFQRLNIRLFGIYEVAPPLDVQNLTAKLAAAFVHRFIYSHHA